MDKPKSLNEIFKSKIFRIPDYQRGYAWQKDQLTNFWEDLINLPNERSHYTGVLTIKEADNINIDDNEYWLAEDHSYKIYDIVDGQQRLTTFVIFIQAFIEFVRKINDNTDKSDKDIYITDSLNLETIINQFLYKSKPNNLNYKTYKFGYTVDNPSYEYLIYKIFNEPNPPSIQETFYTLNLSNAKKYFYNQLESLYSNNAINDLQEIYKRITKKFVFNEYIINDEFDVFVAFETMNNRGKSLSKLELLKNRLIYLTTLYTDKQIQQDDRKNLRDSINEAWKEVYHQLGRNKERPLNDDEFLKAHWIMYFHYSRKKGNDYIKFLLDEQFSPKKIYSRTEHKVDLEHPEEQYISDADIFDIDMNDEIINDIFITESEYIDFVNDNTKTGTAGKPYLNGIRELEQHINEPIFSQYSLEKLYNLKKRLGSKGDLYDFNKNTDAQTPSAAIGMLINFHNQEEKINDVKDKDYLDPSEIKDYVDSLKTSAIHWFNSYYPDCDGTGFSNDEKNALDKLNRIGIRYFRPLVMSILKNEDENDRKVKVFKEIERFIFIVFLLNQTKANYRDTEFYTATRDLDKEKSNIENIIKQLHKNMSYCFDDKIFKVKDFSNFLDKRFNQEKDGYYGWNGLRYFLYEYELALYEQRPQSKMMKWKDLLKTPKDKISIEHIFPQTPTTEKWQQAFANIDSKDYHFYNGSIGNLLLLSMSINSSLQNDDFDNKKNPKYNKDNKKVRHGYSDGSHSEIEIVNKFGKNGWTPATIEERGIELLKFMEKRWHIKFQDGDIKKLLFLPEEP